MGEPRASRPGSGDHVSEIRCVLVTPISPRQEGNGLAHRCRMWQDVLTRLGSLTTLLVPVSGQPKDGDQVLNPLPPRPGGVLPSRAHQAPSHLGRAARDELEGPAPDLVLALGADVGLVAVGIGAGTDALVVVDLNDDDVSLARSMGDDDSALQYARLVDRLTDRVDLLLSVTGFGATEAVPNCIDVGMPVGRASTSASAVTVLMVGNFTYEPNRRGATWFLEHVLPRVQATRPEVKVRLAGRGSEAFEPHGLGYVPELGSLYAEATVAVVPLLEGSGSRIKALEAFAAGVPVVGTAVGLGGLPVRPGTDCLVADEPAEFAAAVLQVLDSATVGSAIADAARTTVAPFDRAAVVDGAVDLLRRALAAERGKQYRQAPDLLQSEEPDGLVVVDEVELITHHLNELAASVFLLVDAPKDAASITSELAALVGASIDDLAPLVVATLSDLVAAGLLLSGQRPHPG